MKNNASPPVPELSYHLLLGLASITRHLELLARTTRASGTYGSSSGRSTASLFRPDNVGEADPEQAIKTKIQHLAAVFVCCSSQSPVFHAHLPQLVAAASLTRPLSQQTRLVRLPQGCESRLSLSLALPRVSFIGILEDAPHSKPLVHLVRDVVPVIEVPWLKEAQKAQYMPVKVNTVLATTPVSINNQKQC